MEEEDQYNSIKKDEPFIDLYHHFSQEEKTFNSINIYKEKEVHNSESN